MSLMMAAGVTFTLNLIAVVLISVLSINSAEAIIVGGGVTGGTALTQGGAFVELTAPFVAPFPGTGNPPSSVGANNFQTPNLYGFNEDQNILLSTTLNVNVGTNIASGQTVASHYVFFDPLNSTSITGFVDFDATIIGIATSKPNLDASDILQNSLVTYLSPTLRGLESNDSVSIDSTNLSRLLIDFTAASPGDYVRVFTQFSPGASVVPLPAALPLYGTGLAIMGFIGWRRKQRKAAV